MVRVRVRVDVLISAVGLNFNSHNKNKSAMNHCIVESLLLNPHTTLHTSFFCSLSKDTLERKLVSGFTYV